MGKLIQKFIGYFEKKTVKDDVLSKGLDAEIILTYFKNVQIIETLATHYNFTAYYFWQPSIFIKKILSSDEINIINNEPSSLRNLFWRTHELLIGQKHPPRFYNLDQIFDSYSESIYLDPFHVSEEGE